MFETYPGGKGGIYQNLINLIPPHETYIELFLGGGAIARHKLPAKKNIGVDIDSDVISHWSNVVNNDASASPQITMGATIATNDGGAVEWFFVCGDAIEFLSSYHFTGNEFVYCDPPYLLETRSGKRSIYKHEFYTREQHIKLLGVIGLLPCPVMLSGYWSELYNKYLSSWCVESFTAYTRAKKMVTEYVWMNYPKPTRLHDYQYLGDGFRERDRIKKKKKRWVDRLNRMPVLERQALLSAIDSVNW